MVVCDAVIRKLPGALGHEESAVEESFSAALEGRPRVPALHPPGRLARPRGAGRAALRGPRPGQALAAGAESRSAASAADRPAAASRRVLRYHAAVRDSPRGSSRLSCAPGPAHRPHSTLHDRCHRQHRARSAAPRPGLPGRRPRARALPGRRGHPPPHPGLRGCRHQAPGQRRCARPSPSASSRSESAWSARSRCTRPRSSASRWPPAATCAAPSSTTCATAWAAAPACASAAGPARSRRPSRPARCRRTRLPGPARTSSPRRARRPTRSRPPRPTRPMATRPSRLPPAEERGRRGRRCRRAGPRRSDEPADERRRRGRRRGRRAAGRRRRGSPGRVLGLGPVARRRGGHKGEERRGLPGRAGHDRGGRARPRARHPGVPGQALPHPERIDGADARDRPARAGRPRELPLQRPRARRHRGVQAAGGRRHQHVRRRAPARLGRARARRTAARTRTSSSAWSPWAATA